MNESFFLRSFFHSELANLEPQIFIALEQSGAENISLLSGRLVFQSGRSDHFMPADKIIKFTNFYQVAI